MNFKSIGKQKLTIGKLLFAFKEKIHPCKVDFYFKISNFKTGKHQLCISFFFFSIKDVSFDSSIDLVDKSYDIIPIFSKEFYHCNFLLLRFV